MAEAVIEDALLAAKGGSVDTVLREGLARGDAVIGTIAPILRHLIATEESSLFAEETVARVRGMMFDLARQLLGALAEADGGSEPHDHPREEYEALVGDLVSQSALISHVHALALEWRLTERLEVQLGLDTVLSPLLQALLASPDTQVAGKAMALLASQTRFVQAQRRMQLPLGELPGDLLHAALLCLKAHAGGDGTAPQAFAAAEKAIHAGYDEGRSRLGLIGRLIIGMGAGVNAALSISHAGVAIFVSALALGSGQERDIAVLSTNEEQVARLALALRAAGAKSEAVEEQVIALHPGSSLPSGFERIGTSRAASLLALSAPGPES